MNDPRAPWRLTRRQFAAGLAASGVAASGLAPAARADSMPEALSCRIFRAGRQVGTAAYQFMRQDGVLTVDLAVELRVKLGFITLFHYKHHNQEQWRGDRLVWFSARTDRNGEPGFANARWNGKGLMVQGSGTRPYLAPPNALGTSYWNFRTVNAPLIDSQNGRMLQVRIADIGPSHAPRADGPAVPATLYDMSGDIRLNLWYAAEHLAGLEYFAHDGSVLKYEMG